MGHMEHMAIEWREINPGYIVSSDGQVGSRRRGGLKILSPAVSKLGYLRLKIFTDGVPRLWFVHRLVAEAFLGPKPTPAHQINHKNGVKSDNRDTNLEWVTPSQNRRHGIDILGNKIAHGDGLPQTKLTKKEVLEIRARLARGETHQHIAPEYGVSRECISAISAGRNWAWLETSEVTA